MRWCWLLPRSPQVGGEQSGEAELGVGGGCVGAIAALHRGEPCGFSLSRRTDWIEWSVRPFLVFDVNDKALLPVLSASSGETLVCATGAPSGADVSRS
ncbi:hypothetical protein ABZ707_10760 [Streptomyces sp. NPDC006923]|uniref:hypothetical protein n=1 Tax=Streptomyces sp. NPDC006923 TaxID=3155355 RepID=UPI0033E44B2A